MLFLPAMNTWQIMPKQFNSNVKIVPTIIDTNFYQLNGAVKQNNKITIGWSGSLTTIKHFEHALPFLKIIKEKYKDRVDIKVIGDAAYKNESLNIKGTSHGTKNGKLLN